MRTRVIKKTLDYDYYESLTTFDQEDNDQHEEAEDDEEEEEGEDNDLPLPHRSRAKLVVVDSQKVIVLRLHGTSAPPAALSTTPATNCCIQMSRMMRLTKSKAGTNE